ncbi:MAG: hypothetical protein NTW16_07110, partial [Bacteroidetes bacterium]|nr:hypothetical protein [Bacteroidota bacterium]
MKQICFLMVLLIISASMAKGQVSINTDNSAPDVSAILDLKSTDKGFLPPRMTTAQRNSIAP